MEGASAGRSTVSSQPSGGVLEKHVTKKPLPKSKLHEDEDSLKRVIIGMNPTHSSLTSEEVASIIRKRDPSAYSDWTGEHMERLYYYLKCEPDDPHNPWRSFYPNGEDTVMLGLQDGGNTFEIMNTLHVEAGSDRAEENAEILKERLKEYAENPDALLNGLRP